MKPYIATLTLGGLLLLCLLYLYAVEWPHAQRKAAEEQRAKQMIGFQSGDVRRMTLEYRGRDAIILDQGPGGQWRLMQPLQYRADHAEVEDVIRDVEVAEVTRVIHEPESDLSDYGLAPPQLTVSFMLADRTEQFFIGEKGPVSSQLYFKRISGPEIYLTNLPIGTSCRKPRTSSAGKNSSTSIGKPLTASGWSRIQERFRCFKRDEYGFLTRLLNGWPTSP